MTAGIYRIQNLIDGKMYIGSSKDMEFRRKEHFRYLAGGYHANQKLQSAFNKYGRSCFSFHFLEEYEGDTPGLLELEQSYLDKLDFRSNYNIALIAGAPMAGLRHTDDAKYRMSVNTSGEKNPMFGVPSPMAGKNHTEEVKQKISDHHTGSGNPMFGKSGALSPTSKKVIVDGIQYDSLTLAGQSLGVTRKVVEYRIKSEKYQGYRYA
jgi:group I intron endonuclease